MEWALVLRPSVPVDACRFVTTELAYRVATMEKTWAKVGRSTWRRVGVGWPLLELGSEVRGSRSHTHTQGVLSHLKLYGEHRAGSQAC